jgi:formylglycine-generating enzyme required for sulfatase activity
MKHELQSYEFEVLSLDERGQVTEGYTRQAQCFTIDLNQGLKLEMVEIPGGNFIMGAPPDEVGRRENESPQHQVSVSSFFMGKFSVTQAQWFAVMSGLPQLHEAFRGDTLPVVNVWWEQALEFCRQLAQQSDLPFRLPSEAEWEYACRAGTTTPFHWGRTITTEVANYDGTQPYRELPAGEFRKRLTPVGSLQKANGFGLYDMHGNVWEWCADAWHDDYQSAPRDGTAWERGGDQGYRVQRGGSWRDSAVLCRTAHRVGDIAHNSDHIVGLRVCLTAPFETTTFKP